MYTIDPTGLVAEYLYETVSGVVVPNTASPGTLDGVVNHDPTNHPLQASADVPPGFIGSASLNYNVLRRLSDSGDPPSTAFAQYVEVPNFPDLTELTVEAWVKVDYEKANPAFTDPAPGTYPDGAVGFGACPQPACKAFSWYLFLSTLQTDRNLILTIIPDNVTQGLPKPADATSGSGGMVSEDIVHGGQWTHIAATFGNYAPGQFIMHTYINGIRSHIENVTAFDGSVKNIPNITDNTIAPSPGDPLRLGQFRSIQASLDYQFSGMLAGVRIYSRALTHAQIQADYRHDICADGLFPKRKSEIKEFDKKDFKEIKDLDKIKEKKEFKEFKEKEFKEIKEPKEKSEKEIFEGGGFGQDLPDPLGAAQPATRALLDRLDAVETAVSKLSHFIGQELRPDLGTSALDNEPDPGKPAKPPKGSKRGRKTDEHGR